MASFSDPIAKKSRQNAKRCILHKKHGGTHATHNMYDCHKHEKGGIPKKGFRKGQRNSTALTRKLPVPMHSFLQRSLSLRRSVRSLKNALKSTSASTIVRMMAPTTPEEAGLVALGGLTVVKINRLVKHHD